MILEGTGLAQARFEKTRRIEYLDSLRGLAALQVMFSHVAYIFPVFWEALEKGTFRNGFVWAMTRTPLHLMWEGPEAVIFFFVLSGFVLAQSYLTRPTPPYGYYLIKRTCRIYLPYLVVMALCTVILLMVFPVDRLPEVSERFNGIWADRPTLRESLKYLVMIGDFRKLDSPAWSLAHEMRISVIFPFIALYVLRYRVWASLVLSGVVMAVYLGSEPLVLGHFAARQILESVFCSAFFIWGCALAKYRERVREVLERFGPWGKTGLFLAVVVLYHWRWEPWGPFLNRDRIVEVANGSAALLILGAALSYRSFQDLLGSGPLLWVGKRSYSLYLIHVPILVLCIHWLPGVFPLFLRVVLGILLALTGSDLFYRFVERPSLQWGHRWAGKYLDRRSSP